MSCTKGKGYPVEFFVREFGFYFQYTWNSDSEQKQKKMRTLDIVFFISK